MTLSLFPLKNFPNELTAILFSILFTIIIITELRILLRDKTKKEDKNSLPLILIGIFLPLTITIFLSFTNLGNISPNFSYLGITILILGFILRQYSITTLGKFFIPTINKQKNQEIIQTGPYKYIRHPSYTGLLLELSGTALALSNIISFTLTITFLLPALIYRIKIEEKFLSKNFKSYQKYKLKTKKLIPFIY